MVALTPTDHWFVFKKDEIVLRHGHVLTLEDRALLMPVLLAEDHPEDDVAWGDLSPDAVLPPSFEVRPRRWIWETFGEELFFRSGRAFHLAFWHRTHRFCGCCGHPTQRHSTERALECLACKHTMYPVISPAVIMAVRRGDALLLARGAHFPQGRYSVLAGFVEPGEDLETAVRREVLEETGVPVGRVTYVGSQPWPFPQSLMVGFVAEGLSEELHLDHRELEDARWVRPGDPLPDLPSTLSISRQLIEDWRRDTGGTFQKSNGAEISWDYATSVRSEASDSPSRA